MFTSDTDLQRKQIFRTGYGYLVISLLCALFGAVYEYFSHEVYSAYMIYAFAFPLVLGTFILFTILLIHCKLPDRLSLNIYNAGVATFTVGSILEGVLEIYGTSNPLLSLYWYVGAFLTGLGALLYLTRCLLKKTSGNYR